MTVPEVKVPEVTVPEVAVPEVTVPEVTVPEVTVPEVMVPKVVGHEQLTEPDVCAGVPEPLFVMRPVEVEVHACIHTTLDHLRRITLVLYLVL